jgi:phosphoglycerate kinase
MERELKALGRVLQAPEKPCIYILGGAKADDSLKISQYVLKNKIADHVLTGGVTGHLFLAAKGVDLGKSNMEFLEKKELMGLMLGIKDLMKAYPGKVEVPIDLAVDVKGKRKEIPVTDLPTDYPIYDIGKNTVKKYSDLVRDAKSIVISGPMGVFENKEFAQGTKKLFEAIASSKAFSLVGGGHTIAAVEELGLAKKMGYVSTDGGALIEFLMGEQLLGVVALEKAASRA